MVESDSDHNVPVDRGGTSGAKPSASLYRSIKGLTNAKLMHLAKRLLAENTPKSYNEALEIAVLFMRSIPPMGYLAEDLFLLFIRLFQSNDGCDTLFLKFLSIAGASTPFLRPLIMAHGARFLASKGRFYDMKHQIHRNCTEWNLEKHQTAKYYKWIVQHAEELGRTGDKYSSDYRVELEHILMTHADLRVLPNASIFQLFIESHAEYPNKVATVLNHFIELFPNVHFLRKYRVENCGDEGSAEDVIKSVVHSAYAPSSIEFALEYKSKLSRRELLLLLFDITLSESTNAYNWERLLYHLLTEAPLDDILEIVQDLFDNELCRAKSIFTVQGTIAQRLKGKSIKYYLATSKIVLFNDAQSYMALYTAIKSATGVTLERQHMEANNPIWLHFKRLPRTLMS